MKKRFLFLLLVLSALSVFPQNSEDVLPLPDSLVGRLKEHRKADLARAEALNAAIMFYYDEHRILEAESYINELTSLSQDLKDNYWKALSLFYKSLCAYKNCDYSGFLRLINKSQEMVESLRETKRTEFLLTQICLMKSAYYYKIKQIPECQNYIERGLAIAESCGFEELKYKLYNNQGTLLMRMESYKEAIAHFKKLFANKKITDETKLEVMSHIATSFQHLKQFDSAFLYLDSILNYIPNAKIKETLIFDNLIISYQQKAVGNIELKQWNEAMQCLAHSSVLLEIHDDKHELAVNYLYKAEANNGIGKYESALALVDSAIIYSREVEEIELEWHAVKLKSEILKNLNDCEKEVENLRYLIILTDTVSNRENILKVQEQRYQHDAQVMEQRYELQRQASRQRQMIIVILSVVLVIIAILVAILVLLNRKRLASELELRNREITAKSLGKMQSNEMLNDVIEKLSAMEEHPEKNVLPGAIRDLKTLVDADTKKDFDLHFVQMHPDFYQKLLADFPKLTPNELRLCAFIKSNLSMKEIAAINGISADSVKTARKRLRKSLNLTGEDTSLLEFLSKY